MVSNNTNKVKKTSGFTIVELLIVIVVIGILAAITIVAYNGVQAKAKTTSAQAAANSAIKKAEIYNTDEATNGYPQTPGALTTGAAGKTYELTGVTFNVGATALATAPTSPSTLNFYKCSGGGMQVAYYNYSTPGWTTVSTGTSTGCTYVTG